ncbi:MAG: hypothetical protein E7Z89_07075 [Cyanobacteria bacterium SIG28]|nr:hypothetical protein [Cyanobacteria bacterium SIG28]
MYKIEFIPTGHVFELPDVTAEELKINFPQDYKILEKNGKKFKDKIVEREVADTKSIRSKVVEQESEVVQKQKNKRRKQDGKKQLLS